MRPTFLTLTLLFAFNLVTEHSGAAESDSANRLLKTVIFQGNHAFSSEELQRELTSVPAFLLSMRLEPDANATSKLAQSLLIRGYQHSGFPNAKVSASVAAAADAAPTLELTVEEGQRFVNGPIQVFGVSDELAAQLIEKLTGQQPSADSFPDVTMINGQESVRWRNQKGGDASVEPIVWELGRPTQFDRVEYLSTKVRELFQSLGYSDVVSDIAFDTNDSDSNQCRLAVNVKQLGEPDRAKEIVVIGAGVNSIKSVLDYLDLQKNVEVTHERRMDIVRRLWQSGRFKKHELTYNQKAQTLTIFVEEQPGIPSLDQPLTENAQVLLRTRDWFIHSLSTGMDMSVQWKDQNRTFWAILSSEGALFDVQTAADDTSTPRLSVVIAQDGLQFDCSSHDQKLWIPLEQLKTEFSVGYSIRANYPSQFKMPGIEPESALSFNATFNAKSRNESSKLPVKFIADISPAEWLPIAYIHEHNIKRDREFLNVDLGKLQCRIRVDSGEIVEVIDGDREIKFGRNLLRQAKQELAAKSSKSNSYNDAQPISTIASYLTSRSVWDALSEVYGLAQSERKHDLQSALAQLSDNGAFVMADGMVDLIRRGGRKDGFSIPADKFDPSNLTKAFVADFGQKLLRYGNFTADSWCSDVVTVMLAYTDGQTAQLNLLLDEIKSDEENGPICFATLTYAMAYVGHPRTTEFAKEARLRLTDASFERDYTLLAACLPPAWLENPLAAMRSLSQEQVTAINEALQFSAVEEVLKIARHPQFQQANASAILFQAQRQVMDDGLQKLIR